MQYVVCSKLHIVAVCILLLMPIAATRSFAATTPYITEAYVADQANLTDADGDGYYETFDFNVRINADMTAGSADVAAKVICVTTGQVWVVDPWTIVGTEVDWGVAPFNEASFRGYLTGPTDLDFTVELWNTTFTKLYDSTTTVTDEPFKAEPAPFVRQAAISAVRNTVDADGDGYYEFFQADFQIEADTTAGSTANVAAKLICITTGQSWNIGPWTISGAQTDYHIITLDQSAFAGRIASPADLDFTVELWDPSFTAMYDLTTTVANEPLKVDPLPVISDARISGLTNTTDCDGDGYLEQYTFNVDIDADAPDGSTEVAARVICTTTGQTWNMPPWTITGWATDYHSLQLTQDGFKGYISGPSALDFTVELWDATFTRKLTTKDSVIGEPVLVEPPISGPLVTIAAAKALPDQSEVRVTGVVTAVFNGFIYIEDQSRTYGIRLLPVGGWSIGDHITASGVTLGSGSERYIRDTCESVSP